MPGRRSKPLLPETELQAPKIWKKRSRDQNEAIAAAPFDAFCLLHPAFRRAPALLKSRIFIKKQAIRHADELPMAIELFLAALRRLSNPAFQDGVPLRARVARLMHGKGLRKVAQALGISPARLSKWERSGDETLKKSQATLSNKQVTALAEALGVDKAWLRHANPKHIPKFLEPWHVHMKAENRKMRDYLTTTKIASIRQEQAALELQAQTLITKASTPDQPFLPDPALMRALTAEPLHLGNP